MEDFLPAKAVGHDEDDVLRFVLGGDFCALGLKGYRDGDGDQRGECYESGKTREWQARDLEEEFARRVTCFDRDPIANSVRTNAFYAERTEFPTDFAKNLDGPSRAAIQSCDL